MMLIVYSIIIFIITLLIQLLLIILIEKIKLKRIKKSTVEDDYKRNMKFIIKVLLAIIVSFVIAILSFFGMGIYVIAELRTGH